MVKNCIAKKDQKQTKAVQKTEKDEEFLEIDEAAAAKLPLKERRPFLPKDNRGFFFHGLKDLRDYDRKCYKWRSSAQQRDTPPCVGEFASEEEFNGFMKTVDVEELLRQHEADCGNNSSTLTPDETYIEEEAEDEGGNTKQPVVPGEESNSGKNIPKKKKNMKAKKIEKREYLHRAAKLQQFMN